MARTFKVGHSKNNRTDKLTRYFVTDADDESELDTRPIVAEFPIGEKYDEDEQLRHANLFAGYMNQIQKSKEIAYEQTLIMDIMKQ